MGTTLIASIATSGRGMTTYRKVLTSDKNIFALPHSLEASIDYNPGSVLEDNEWFRLTDFTSKPYCPQLLKKSDVSFSSVDFDSIGAGDFGKIIFLCGNQEGYYFFHRVTASRQVSQKRLFFGETCRFEESDTSISLNECADAIYNPSTKNLYFRKLRDISAIFDGIDELYREATEEEVKNFLGYNFINLTGGFSSDNVKTNNRKRIALALETLSRFSDDDKKTIFEYVKDYCPELSCENIKFNINNEESLKKLLFGIE